MAIDGTVNDDSLSGTGGDDEINGFDGDDQLFGGGGVDIINGGNDNDFIDGGLGADTMNGGAGFDRIQASVGDTVNGGADVDFLTLDLSSVTSNIVKALDFTAGVQNTVVTGTKFQNIEIISLTTGSGNDTITFDSSAIYTGGTNNSSAWNGGGGTDRVIVDWSDQVFAISGNASGISIGSVFFSFGALERFDFSGGASGDNFTGGADSDTFNGNDGNDTLNAFAGNDTLNGGAGNDTITAGNSIDNAGTDTIDGGQGDDIINAAFKDSINGGQGRDSLTLDLADRSADATLVFDPTASNTVQQTTFQGIESLFLTTGSGDDSVTLGMSAIIPSPSTDFSWNANGGNDTLTVDFSGAFFTVQMSAGSITTGDYSVSISLVEFFNYTSGSGNDSVQGSALADVLTANAGNDSISGLAGADELNGGTGRDVLAGGADGDTLDGGDDRDTLSGEDGKDKVFGGDGRDNMFGGLDDDDLRGGEGNDRIQGDAGKDKIDGGTENDIIAYGVVGDSTGKNFDTVANFNFSSEDKFHFNTGVSSFAGTDNNGSLSSNSFNNDLENEIGSLASHAAIIFNPNAGTFAGSTFVIVDVNGVVGYQADEDFVIRLTTPANPGQADLTDFQG